MQGRYTSIVADLSILSGAYEMSLCNVGIMGTKYERTETSPLTTPLRYGTTSPDAAFLIRKISVKAGFSTKVEGVYDCRMAPCRMGTI